MADRRGPHHHTVGDGMKMANGASSIDLVYEAIVSEIREGVVQVGDRLPTEQALCQKYAVGRSTVREAMRMLHSQGFVKIKRGSGTYVTSREGSDGGQSRWILSSKDDMRDYIDLRIAIEELAVRLFIRRFDEKDLENLKSVQERFEKAIEEGDVSRMTEMDEAFHSGIAGGGKNELLMNVNQLLASSFHEYRNITFTLKEHHADAISAHRGILDAIERHDTNEAVFNIRSHLQTSLKNAISQRFS